jgi:hypothetical protein
MFSSAADFVPVDESSSELLNASAISLLRRQSAGEILHKLLQEGAFIYLLSVLMNKHSHISLDLFGRSSTPESR